MVAQTHFAAKITPRKTLIIFPHFTQAKISSNDSEKLAPSPHKKNPLRIKIPHTVDLFKIPDVDQRFEKDSFELSLLPGQKLALTLLPPNRLDS